MCFTIDPKRQTKWQETKVYKRLSLYELTEADYPHTMEFSTVEENERVMLVSPYRETQWWPGEYVASNARGYSRAKQSYFNVGFRRATHGIYVYRTLRHAKHWCNSGEIIVELEVSPADFIFHDMTSTEATYKKVLLPDPFKSWGRNANKHWIINPFTTEYL